MAGPVPTPGEWLSQALASAAITHAAIARRIGRSRAEITRWTSGREQIPRMHLAEIAEQIGGPDTLDYALRLKDCEDAQDHVRRSSLRLAKRIGTSSIAIDRKFLATVDTLSDSTLSGVALLRERMRLLTAAGFAVVQWTLFTEEPNRDLITPDSIGRHLRYPVNHFIGTLLEVDRGRQDPYLSTVRTAGLVNLGDLAKGSVGNDSIPLLRHHAIHMLGRYGDAGDRAIVQEMTSQSLNSDDKLFQRLGYSGLMMAQGSHSDVADKYLFQLTRDSELATVDLAFDATHYGDLPLGSDAQLRSLDRFAPMMIKNIVKHYSRPATYGRLAEIDAFRALSALELCQPSEVPSDVRSMLISSIESGAIRAPEGIFQRLLSRNLSLLPRGSDPSRQVASAGLSELGGATTKRVAEHDVCIAYSSTDGQFARRLDQCLTSKGLNCWIDFRGMVLGKPYQESIQRGLESSRAIVVVLGGSLGSWQRLELQVAVTRFIESDRLVIPFVISGPVIPAFTPIFLREFHGIVLDRYADLDSACREIVKALSSGT